MEYPEFLKRLQKTGLHSDLKLICGTESFDVHRCIICSISPWFERACEPGKWKEGASSIITLTSIYDDIGTTQRHDVNKTKAAITPNNDLKGDIDGSTPTGEVETPKDNRTCCVLFVGRGEEDISRDHPIAVRLMVDYLYTGDYNTGELNLPNPQPEVAPKRWVVTGSQDVYSPFGRQEKKAVRKEVSREVLPQGSLTLHARMFALGMKYEIPSLKDLAYSKFTSQACDVYHINTEELINAISFIGKTSAGDDRLLDKLIALLADDAESYIQEKPIQAAIEQVDGLTWALMMKLRGVKRQKS